MASQDNSHSKAQPLTWAEFYARRLGWHVFPLHTPTATGCSCGWRRDRARDGERHPVGKHPRTRRGLLDATTDLETIRRWWNRWSEANVGIRTGTVSGIWVLDVDPDAGGEESLEELVREHGPLPETVEQITGGLGEHWLWSIPEGVTVPNGVSTIAPGLDTRGEGGYIVVEPSLHVSGRRYRWEASSIPTKVPIAPAPDWLLRLVLERGRSRKAATPTREWIRLLTEGVSEGRRNDSIARLAGHLLRRNIPFEEALALLLAWNDARCEPPLSPEEVGRTVVSVATRELARREGRIS